VDRPKRCLLSIVRDDVSSAVETGQYCDYRRAGPLTVKFLRP
jgi:hypothetical protein